jgi:molybdopterin molybdotransferase
MDIRQRGFPDRAPLAEAQSWLDALPAPRPRTLPAAAALGLLLAEPILAPHDLPDRDRAFVNGFSVRAAGTEGASAYNPLAASRTQIASGTPMPNGDDAVAPFESVDEAGLILAAIAPGEGVLRRGEQIRAAAELLPAGRRLRPGDLALLAAFGIEPIQARPAPSVALMVAGPKHGPDLLTALLANLLAQHGAQRGEPEEAHLLLLAGRAGTGADDSAPAALAASGGQLDLHGLAIRPGGSSGLGWRGKTPLLLLPGDPLACLAAFTLLAAPLLRRWTGRPALPPLTARLRRKLVSSVGTTDLARIRLLDGVADPLGAIETGGLPGLARSDGYVLIPEASEGVPAGAPVKIHPWEAP